MVWGQRASKRTARVQLRQPAKRPGKQDVVGVAEVSGTPHGPPGNTGALEGGANNIALQVDVVVHPIGNDAHDLDVQKTTFVLPAHTDGETRPSDRDSDGGDNAPTGIARHDSRETLAHSASGEPCRVIQCPGNRSALTYARAPYLSGPPRRDDAQRGSCRAVSRHAAEFPRTLASGSTGHPLAKPWALPGCVL